jgi:hypothetical protein
VLTDHGWPHIIGLHNRRVTQMRRSRRTVVLFRAIGFEALQLSGADGKSVAKPRLLPASVRETDRQAAAVCLTGCSRGVAALVKRSHVGSVTTTLQSLRLALSAIKALARSTVE